MNVTRIEHKINSAMEILKTKPREVKIHAFKRNVDFELRISTRYVCTE